MHSSLHLVAGLGKTGQSIVRYLRRRNQPCVVFDTRPNPPNLSEFKKEFPDVEVFLGQLPNELYSEITAIISSPGVALDHPSIQKALEQKIPIMGDIECLARAITAPVIAITGTNGKSTVTTLVGEMAKQAGMSVAVAGNIGSPVLDLLNDGVHYDLWVLELSSFQLDLVDSLAPIAATILNITPDHLDRHHDFANYVKAKQRVYQHAKNFVYNRSDQQTIPSLLEVNTAEKTISFGLDLPKPGHWGVRSNDGMTELMYGHEPFIRVDELRIKGRHNWQNVLAACALAQCAGITLSSMKNVLRRFTGLPHRCQWVRTLDQVEWINDSKGTNVGATISAISGIGGSMLGKIVLIAGGQGKGADFSELRASIGDYVRAIVLIGEDAVRIEQALDDVVDVFHAKTLDAAVTMAKAEAKPGDVVLLSPACASFDMFKDFNHRGELFSRMVEDL